MPTLPSRASSVRRKGLTLVELIIVMVILVALAGIIIPLLPGLIGRAETSSRATNSQEIYKAVQTFEALYTNYPSDWDSLTDGTSTTPLAYVSGFTGTTPALAITALTPTQITALRGAGVTRVQKMVVGTAPLTSPNDTTFNPYPTADRSTSGDGIAVSGTTLNLPTLTSAGQYQLNLSDNAATSNGVFVVLGFGKRCSIVGAGVNEAPFNFFDNAALSPNTRYARYVVVFQVNGPPLTSPTSAAADFSRAKLVRVARPGGTLATGDDAIQSYWVDVASTGGS